MSLIGDRLREARDRKNLKQTQVMEKTGINNKTLSGYEKGVSEPDIETLKILSELYEVSGDWLMGRTNDRNRVLQPHSRKMIELFEQNKTAEEIYQAFNEQFLVGGLPMAKDEALFIIDYVRTKWTMEMKQGHDHASKH